MARKLNDPNNQEGSGLNQALLDAEQQRQMQEQEQRQSAQPQLATRSRVSQAGQQASPTIKSMPQQQPAGTGTFTNLRKYLEAAKPSQQRIAQVATQRVEGLAGAAQKGIQQAKESFGRNIEAGSLANMGEALGQAQNIIGAARGVTYQPQQVTPPATPPVSEEQPQQMEATSVEQSEAPVEQVPPQAPTPQQYISPEDQARFAEIINAAYQGPSSLQEAGLYSGAAEKARRAQQTIGDVQTATGRERLLRDVFGRTRDYTAGQSLLDQLLLNTSGEGVRSVQEAAQRAGNLEQVMQQAVRETAAQAGQRREAIAGIRGQAREALTSARTEEEKAVEKRIDDLITTPAVDEQGNKIAKLDSRGKPVVDAEGNPVYLTEWERLPAYFQDIFRQRQTNKALPLSAREMEILGLSSGQGLFNVGQEAIGGVAAERERLITKDELARQLALQQLAGLDVSKELQKDLRYTDLEKAGTQDLLSSLDVGKFERTLKEAGKTSLTKSLKDIKLPGGTPEFYNQSIGPVLKKLGLNINKATQADVVNFLGKKINEFKGNLDVEKKKFENWLEQNPRKGWVDPFSSEGMARSMRVNRARSELDKAERTYEGFKKVYDEFTKRGLRSVTTQAEPSSIEERSRLLEELLNRKG